LGAKAKRHTRKAEFDLSSNQCKRDKQQQKGEKGKKRMTTVSRKAMTPEGYGALHRIALHRGGARTVQRLSITGSRAVVIKTNVRCKRKEKERKHGDQAGQESRYWE